MPIPTNTTSTIAVPQTLACNALYVDQLTINATDRAAYPTVAIQVTPYKVGVDGEPDEYASVSEALGTSNLFAAAANIPAIAVAIQAVYGAVAQWHAYMAARRADVATARDALATATAAVPPAQQAIDQAAAARQQAYAARLELEGTEDEADAVTAWNAADATWQAALAMHQGLQEAVVIAASRVTVAEAALADPANPPLAQEAQA